MLLGLPLTGRADPKDAGAAPPKAEATAGYAAEVLVLHATNSKKGIDPRIGGVPELKNPPFSAYDSYELVDKTRLPLVKGAPRTMPLPNGRVLETLLIEELPKDFVRLKATIKQPGGREDLLLGGVKAKLGKQFILAGQSYKAGILVLVVRIVR